MKRYAGLMAVAAVLGLMLSISVAFAADKIVTAKVSAVIQATDRNGNPYTRVMIEEPRNLKGIEYTASVPAFAFGPEVSDVSGLQAGDTIKFIGSSRTSARGKSYTVLKVLTAK